MEQERKEIGGTEMAYKFRDLAFSRIEGGKFVVTSSGCLASFDNPKEAIVYFASRVEHIMTEETMHALAGEFNPHTGEKL